jgi:serine protease AprX
MELTIGAARAGSATANSDGSGWTRCARTLAMGAVAAATVLSGAAMATHVSAASVSHPEKVVVRGAAGCATSVANTVRQLGGTVTRRLGILDGAAATVASDRISALRAAPCVAAVTPDGSVTLSSFGGYDPTLDTGSLYNTTQLTGAQSFWNAGYTGKGVDVALIDSGVSPVTGLNATAKIINGPDISFDSQSSSLQSLDGYGHGTHMASIIAGRDVAMGPRQYVGNTSQFLGVAPDARVVNVKVADAYGAADISQIIAGMDWTVQHQNNSGLNIGVLNLSFGTDSLQGYMLDPLAFAADVAWRSGIVVVVAAGNGGTSTASLADPAIDPFVIAVGAADTNGTNSTADDTVASFSQSGNASRSPDLVAPGVHIEGLRDPGSYIDNQFGSTATVAGRFLLGSGTSQATAVVSGAAALVLSKYPNASPDQVKYLLTSTATPLAGQDATRQGHGELNLAAALYGTSPSSVAKQRFQQSAGLGTLDAARGSIHLVNSGIALTGERDIFGHAWNNASMASAESSQTAWSGGTFNGSGWSGSGWSGSGWSGSGWSTTIWTSNAWSGSGWSGSGWSGNVWTGSGWSGSGWSGSGWSGSGWSGSGWSGSGWSGSGWSGSGWSASGWSNATWS